MASKGGYASNSDENSKDSNLVKQKKTRQYLRQRVTKLYNTILSCDFSDSEARNQIERLISLKNKLTDIDETIFVLVAGDDPESDVGQQELTDIEDYEAKIDESLSKLQSQTNDPPVRGMPVLNKLKLPEISMPIFANSKNESLEKFFYSFESIINKHHLSVYEKFVYLRGQLQGAPKTLIDSLDPSQQKYNPAKELLFKAFGNTLSQKYDSIQKLSNLKLNVNGDPYSYIGDIQTLISSFEHLRISVDDILQYFIWQGFNDRFQNQLIQITNSTKPTIKEILDNIFDATERYIKVNERINERKNYYQKPKDFSHENAKNMNTNTMAVDVKRKNVVPCHLCVADGVSNVGHQMKDCKIYLTALEKINRLEYYKFCSKCSFKNHSTVECRFKFASKCFYCKGEHQSFLCGSQVKKDPEKTINKMSWIQNLQADCDDSILLPSFTAKIKFLNRLKCVRALKDSGSQRNFIVKNLVDELDLKTCKENIELKINGFNSSRDIKTKSVYVPINFGYDVRVVEAVVVPEINIKLNVPGVNLLAEVFKNKGYELADIGLLNCNGQIDKFDLVLGAESDALLRTTTVFYGNGKNSYYVNSSIGVILSGSVDANLDYLNDLPHDTFPKVESGTKTFLENSKRDCNESKILEKDSDDTLGEVKLVETDIYSNVTLDLWDDKGEINIPELEKVTNDLLNEEMNKILNYDNIMEHENSEVNDKLIDYVLDNTDRLENGRLIMPLTWNADVKNRLGTNFNLSKSILKSNFNKLSKSNDALKMYNDVFKEQERLGIIERIENIQSFLQETPGCSFLPHMGIFKLDRQSSKCRVVFLSNLCEKNAREPNAVSHNQALLPGPSLNHKLSTSVIFSRFDRFMLTFDIQKAFLGIALRECDQNRLLFLWYRSVENGNFDVIAYRNLRLSFGLRPSPSILMLGLYKILIQNTENDTSDITELKRLIFHTIYMDNGCISSNDESYLFWAYENVKRIFNEYQFDLQQFTTNLLPLQQALDEEHGVETEEKVKYFGMNWQRNSDTLSPFPPKLNMDAMTKRTILSSINSIYDIFNLYGPILNRAKLFFQKLQLDHSFQWDDVIPECLCMEWKKIVKQVNSTPEVKINRYVGSRSEQYDLIAFSDASTSIYGVVVYIRERSSKNVNFLLAKSKLINNQIAKKTIPTLECLALSYATEVIIELYNDLSSSNAVIPVNIVDLRVYTDSMVNLYWLSSYFHKYDKMQKRSVYIMNRLENIKKNCQIHPVIFSYIEGKENPGDYASRAISYDRLSKTNFYSGPEFLRNELHVNEYEVHVPDPFSNIAEDVLDPATAGEKVISYTVSTNSKDGLAEQLLSLERHSSFERVIRIKRYVLLFAKKLMIRSKITGKLVNESNLFKTATNMLISIEQQKYYPEVFKFFQSKSKLKDIPNIVMQMNLCIDEYFILRVRGKFSKGNFPILLHNNSYLARLIILELHDKLSHMGIYSTLRSVRRSFWIQRGFSTVRKVLRECITCKRANERPIKINQNCYREFRSSPPQVPYSYIFVDYMGPFRVKMGENVIKVYVLVVTCLWSRAINLVVCYSLDVPEFLRAIQTHIYEYGLFRFCISDLGSQITAGSKIIMDLIDDPDSHHFFKSQGIDHVKFDQYCKGNSSLGALVENCVKQTKQLINKSIRNYVLDFKDFNLLIAKVIHLINQRPVSFKQGLREYSAKEEIPESITPENLVRGYELVTYDVVPQTQALDPMDSDCYTAKNIRNNHFKFQKVHGKLKKVYHEEFLVQLLSQAVDQKERYKPVKHKRLAKGDIVLLVEPHTKQVKYPMGIIHEVETNSIGEVVAATVFKGKTREKVYRHSSSLILLIQSDALEDNLELDRNTEVSELNQIKRPERKAATLSRGLTRSLINEDLI